MCESAPNQIAPDKAAKPLTGEGWRDNLAKSIPLREALPGERHDALAGACRPPLKQIFRLNAVSDKKTPRTLCGFSASLRGVKFLALCTHPMNKPIGLSQGGLRSGVQDNADEKSIKTGILSGFWRSFRQRPSVIKCIRKVKHIFSLSHDSLI
jgi:hypothetical protein